MRPGDALHPRRAGALAGVVFAAALLLSMMLAAPAQAGFPGFPAKIAFHSDRDGTYNIYTVNSDGTGLTQLTFDSGGQEGPQSIEPAWSPDGLKIVYSRYTGLKFEIWVMNADGSGKQPLTDEHSSDDHNPSFSFDGTKIAYESFAFDGGFFDSDVVVMSSAGTGSTLLTDDGSNSGSPFDGNPVFSQNGLIYFDSNRGGEFQQVYSMNADGSGQTQLTSEPGYNREPDPSPDGELVAFSSSREDPMSFNGQLWLMGPAGGSDVVVPTAQAHAGRPAFSPGTQRLTFEGGSGSFSTDISVVGTGGGTTSFLTAGPIDDGNPDWQPAQYQCWGLAPTIVGGFTNTVINGTAGDDVIVGLGGNDTIKGFRGNDKLCGEAGRDKIFGGKGNDVLIGGPGSDQLFGGPGKDKIFGGSPNAKGKNVDGDRNKCSGGKGDDKAGIDCNIKKSIP